MVTATKQLIQKEKEKYFEYANKIPGELTERQRNAIVWNIITTRQLSFEDFCKLMAATSISNNQCKKQQS